MTASEVLFEAYCSTCREITWHNKVYNRQEKRIEHLCVQCKNVF
jgi:NAD-dependent SIR2 family protein deacetylase